MLKLLLVKVILVCLPSLKIRLFKMIVLNSHLQKSSSLVVVHWVQLKSLKK